MGKRMLYSGSVWADEASEALYQHIGWDVYWRLARLVPAAEPGQHGAAGKPRIHVPMGCTTSMVCRAWKAAQPRHQVRLAFSQLYSASIDSDIGCGLMSVMGLVSPVWQATVRHLIR